jgi:hypothetical protein
LQRHPSPHEARGEGEKSLRTITLTGYRRPALFRQTLASLAANDLDGWRIVIRIEPSDAAPEFAAIAASMLRGRDCSLTVNARVLGVRDNPLGAIDQAFAEGSTLNLCLEEDLLLAPDATALAAWYARHHQPGWLCLNLMAGPCGSTGPLSDRRHPDALFVAKAFNSLGFAVRGEEWHAHMRAAWLRRQTVLATPDGGRPKGWDWSIYALVATGELATVQPVLARATHTGRTDGTFCPPEFHDRAFTDLPIATGAADYRLVELGDLPHEVRSHIHVMDELSAARRAIADALPPWRRWLGRWR